jgi:hypothetical protein
MKCSPYMYTQTHRKFCKRDIPHCHYEISGQHSNKLSTINTLNVTSSIVSHERTRSLLFPCAVSIMWVLIILVFWRAQVNCDPGSCSRYSDWLLAVRPRDSSSSPGKGKIFLLSMFSRPVLGPIQPPIQWVCMYVCMYKGGPQSWPLHRDL